jgi:anhydro-N-acetylmuramic acid kinase
LLHRRLFFSPDENRAILNIGGISNITCLGMDGSVSGFDCGPGNCLMDAWIRQVSGERYDRSGAWAASGQVDEALLNTLLEDPFFSLPAPKSTGIEYFNLAWLESRIGALDMPAADLQCTLAELTASSIVRGLVEPLPERLLVCGGGVHNAYLLFRLGQLLPSTIVESTLNQGADPDWVEAILFAWLACERLSERPQDTSAITGAQNPVLLGRIHLTNRDRIIQIP